MNRPDELSPATGAKNRKFTPKRAGWLTLNIFVPASDIAGMARYTGRNLSRLWQRLRDVTAGRGAGSYRPDSWSQAVADTGLPAERLARNFRISRWFWWSLMWLTGLPATGFMLMLISAGSSVSGTGWLRVGCVLLVMMMLAATGFVQALAVSYRLWQLTEKRVSEAEAGSFRDFLQETHWCRQVLSGGLL